ncbi:MAG TPA: DUF5068 domain-containing protein [Cerasibacillus sp.]|uniref:DUF5068 domain-containing protein n=1 Tax=Cerasibacillus sp. TaxID=2498711 RepID=UPI002F415DEE
MRKALVIIGIVALTLLMLVACGKEDASKDEPKDTTKKEEVKDDEDKKDEDEEENNKDKTSEDEKDSAEGEIMNPAIAEETGGDVEVIFTNDNPEIEHEMNGLVVKINKYQVVRVTDMNQSSEHQFPDLEGYVITADITTENTSDQTLYYSPTFRIQTDDRYDYISSRNIYYIPEDKEIQWEEPSTFPADSEYNFYHVFLLDNEEFEKVSTLEPKFFVEAGVADNKDYKGSYKEEGFFDFAINEEQVEKLATATKFYEDKLTTDSIATKELIFEKTDINETQELDKFKFTVEGVQYTEITPNESSKERFRNFGDNDLVALTIQVAMDNQSNEVIYGGGGIAKLNVNDNEMRFSSQNMVENIHPQELHPGDKGYRQIVFIFDKKYFELYDKFDLEVGPFTGPDVKRLFKEKTLHFDLPAPK